MDDRITTRVEVCHGKPVVRGTRVLVSAVLSAIAGGDPIEQVADDYRIEVSDVLACVAFAAREIDDITFHVHEQ